MLAELGYLLKLGLDRVQDSRVWEAPQVRQRLALFLPPSLFSEAEPRELKGVREKEAGS